MPFARAQRLDRGLQRGDRGHDRRKDEQLGPDGRSDHRAHRLHFAEGDAVRPGRHHDHRLRAGGERRHVALEAEHRAQPLRLLQVGLRGSFADQEGVSLYLEAALGLMCSDRLRTLAARVKGVLARLYGRKPSALDAADVPLARMVDPAMNAALKRIGARIVAVADVYDALTSDRPYRRAMSVDEARATLEAQAGGALDMAARPLRPRRAMKPVLQRAAQQRQRCAEGTQVAAEELVRKHAEGKFILDKYENYQRYGLDVSYRYMYNDGKYEDIYVSGFGKLKKWLEGGGKLLNRLRFDDLLFHTSCIV